MSGSTPSKYPLLEEILEILGLKLKTKYTTKDAAQIFEVTPRAILNWIESGKMATGFTVG